MRTAMKMTMKMTTLMAHVHAVRTSAALLLLPSLAHCALAQQQQVVLGMLRPGATSPGWGSRHLLNQARLFQNLLNRFPLHAARKKLLDCNSSHRFACSNFNEPEYGVLCCCRWNHPRQLVRVGRCRSA